MIASIPLRSALIVAALCTTFTAYAQEGTTAPPAETSPTPVAAPLPPASDGTMATTTTSTTSTTMNETETSSSCPYGCDEPSAYARWKRPHFVVGIGAGIGAWTEGHPFAFSSGTGSVTSAGPAWQLLVGWEFARWFALELHYDGIHNKGKSEINVGGTVGLLTSAGTLVARFTIPTPVIQPYFLAGVGVYHQGITGSSDARAKTPFHGSTSVGAPLGVGVAMHLTGRISIGAELVYHRLFGESFADDDDIGGGDPTTGSLVLRGRL